MACLGTFEVLPVLVSDRSHPSYGRGETPGDALSQPVSCRMSVWSTGRFAGRNRLQGEIRKLLLTVNMIQRSNLLTEVPLKEKRRGKGQISQKKCFHCICPHPHITKTTSVAFLPEGF